MKRGREDMRAGDGYATRCGRKRHNLATYRATQARWEEEVVGGRPLIA